MKIGFFGGCFNPPSNIHINLAKNVINEYKLDKLIFVPVGDYYDKKDLIPAKHRYLMLKFAVENEKSMEVDDITINAKTKLYASDTFKLIREKYKNDQIYFVMGSDNFRNMPNWKDYNELIKNYKIIVIERERKQIRNTNKNNIYEFIPTKLEETDSTKIRKMIKENKDVHFYINEKVLKYIKENDLYKN